MKICIPVLEENDLNSPVSAHFGQSRSFALIDDDTNDVTFVKNDGTHHGGTVPPPQIIANSGADALLCGGLGVKAVRMFEQLGVHVYCNASGTVAEALNAYKAGKLPEATDANACQHHH